MAKSKKGAKLSDLRTERLVMLYLGDLEGNLQDEGFKKRGRYLDTHSTEGLGPNRAAGGKNLGLA